MGWVGTILIYPVSFHIRHSECREKVCHRHQVMGIHIHIVSFLVRVWIMYLLRYFLRMHETNEKKKEISFTNSFSFRSTYPSIDIISKLSMRNLVPHVLSVFWLNLKLCSRLRLILFIPSPAGTKALQWIMFLLQRWLYTRLQGKSPRFGYHCRRFCYWEQDTTKWTKSKSFTINSNCL